MTTQRYYTNEKNSLVLIALLKAHGIKKIITSPGTTNHTLTASLQNDKWFEMYSSVDERSAAYMACGLAAESGESVLITCTEATASRNYMPGLTEAYYRKLPILAVTTTHGRNDVGSLTPQVLDHTVLPKDLCVHNTFIPVCRTDKDMKIAAHKINEAILELTHRGGGPVVINMETLASRDYSVRDLPEVKVIKRYTLEEKLPELPNMTIGIFIGSHKKFTAEETQEIDKFCEQHDAVVFCDHTSGYKGKYRVDFSLVAGQMSYRSPLLKNGLIIHIGEVSGDYFSMIVGSTADKVWRVNPDGQIRDTFGKLEYVFEMSEYSFFKHYNHGSITTSKNVRRIDSYINEYNKFMDAVPDLPFSKVWVASRLLQSLPNQSAIHFSILGSLRAGNFFKIPKNVDGGCNVGGFGIDGATSTLLGASLSDPGKLYFLMTGDLAFFYDWNAIGNRHLGPNIRILLINNGDGTEFRMHWHPCSMFDKEVCDEYMSAGGHYGNKSRKLMFHVAEDLGFEYLCASNKEEFNEKLPIFVHPEIGEKPIIFEVFTDSEIDSDVVDTMRNLISDNGNINRQMKKKAKSLITSIIGEDKLNTLKNIIK